ncbi:MAG TPA: site-specific integrase [Terracidiphilus sp.]|nr:site-specific integrase [Terracidiphilus sp.]HEV2398049.1 site-specific integrase [Candidatus Sulfotelmatobacter sp.]
MSKARYQKGCVSLIKNGSGQPVWVFRWRTTLPDGKRVPRQKVIGTPERFNSKAAAEKAAAGLRLLINADGPNELKAITMQALIEHYKKTELIDQGDEGKSFSTRHRYESCLRRWIEPRWGTHQLGEIKTVAVEQWLRQVDRANGTKAKIRNLMGTLFNHAIRWEFTDRNPITGPVRGSGVRQSSKRARVPDVLTIEEMQALLAALDVRERTLVFLAMVTGLRMGELAGLKWKDADFANLLLHVERSVVYQVVGRCKTEASKKPVPLDEYLAQDLLEWYRYAPCVGPEDWIFASTCKRAGKKRGQVPLWLQPVMRYHVVPAARRVGITKRLGWHTFRHTYSTLLKDNGEDVKVVQELLRHASVKITLDIYTQAMTPAKRKAQSRVVAMIRPELRGNGGVSEGKAEDCVHEIVHGNLPENDAKSLI